MCRSRPFIVGDIGGRRSYRLARCGARSLAGRFSPCINTKQLPRQLLIRLSGADSGEQPRIIWAMCSQDLPDNILVDIGAERKVDLLRDAWATKCGLALFHVVNSINE